MAKTSKKALGAAMAGVMAVGAVAGAAGAVQEVRAGVAEDVKLIHAKIEHFRTSLKKNYLGLKNVGQWQAYEKEIKALIAKLPAGSSQDKYQARLDVCVSLLNAAAKVNHVEKSLDTNYNGIKNAETWSVYLKDGNDLLGKVDKEFEGRKAELVERLAKAKTTVDGIIKTHETDLAAAEALFVAAEKSMVLADAEKALAAAKKLGTHTTSAALVAKCEALVAKIGQEFAVTSVQALNASEIKVTFNKEVNKDSATLASNYDVYVGNSTAETATKYRVQLQEDKTSVILQFVNNSNDPIKGIENGQSYKVDVATKVLDSQYKPVKEYKGTTALFSDKTAPKLVKSELAGSTLTLTFDEAVSGVGSLKVDGITVSGASYVRDAGVYEVSYTITDTAMLKDGEHKIAVYSATDFSGNSEVLINGSYVATQNNVKPSVKSVEAKSTNTFRVTFDSPVSTLTTSNFEVKKGNYTLVGTPSKYDTVGKVWDVTVSSNDLNNPVYAKDENSVSLSVVVKDVKGTNNIFGDKYATSVVLTKDTTKPVVQSEAINSIDTVGNKLIVIFNEDLKSVSMDKINISKDGVRVTTTNASAALNGTDKKKVEISLAIGEHTIGDGVYTVSFAADAVKDIADNGNAALTTKVNSSVVSGTELTNVGADVSQNVAKNNVITVTYTGASSKGMTDSAINLANYKLDGVPLNSPLFAGIDIAFTAGSDKKIVEIVLPKGQVVSNNYTAALEISKDVKDSEGKYVSNGNKGTKVISLGSNWKDDVAPVLRSAEFVKQNSNASSTNVVKLTFSEPVTTTDVKDYISTVGTSTVKVGHIVRGSNVQEVIVRLVTDVNLSQTGSFEITSDKTLNTDGVINIADERGNEAVAKSVTLSSSVVDSSIYQLANPGAPVAPNAVGGTLKITSVNDTMEYKAVSSTEWTPVTANATEITGLNAGKYEVRVKASGYTPAGLVKEVTVMNAKPVTPNLTGGILKATGATAGTVYQVSTNGTIWTDVTASSAGELTLAAGTYSIKVKATELTPESDAQANVVVTSN
ncbi:MAG: hypothetical protein RR637_09310 [Clostridium sp.]|uniref:hypothetical protein n=1 Tax=Clostridium sp. TaxID=1506 RepID=UPI002FC7132F